MKKIYLFLIASLVVFSSCSSDDNNTPQQVNVTLKFTHNWDGTPVTSLDFNNINFTNANGEQISIERLRYAISNITIIPTGANVIASGTERNFINVGENTGLTLNTTAFTGQNSVLFRFGFSDANNQDGVYQDLNVANFNVPAMLGGGYHYMQFDGKYLDASNQEQPFNYHAIRAVDRTDPQNIIFEDTSFVVDLGQINITGNVEIEIKMNIAEWFKNPNTWDLNQLNTVLMPNFNAQKLMSANGKTVFSLGEVTQ